MNSSNFSYQYNFSTALVIASPGKSLFAQWTASLQLLYYPLLQYFLPVLLAVGTFNNIICIVVFIFDKEFYNKTSKTTRIYYLFIAIFDLIAIYAIPFPWFIGDGLYGLTNGAFSLYVYYIIVIFCYSTTI